MSEASLNELNIDYEKVGFKSGLEIHQQLDTKKLFCNCPSVLRKDDPDFVVKRKLHVVAGESGEVDVAAKYQASLDKEFVYQGYDSTCLIELDEEPPHEINREALKIALQVAVLLNCKIQSVTQIMRKTVVDGSNTGGFQRTVLIAYNGFVETSQGKVGIESVCLEEDSARKIESTKNNGKGIEVYRLDRLGIPLIEIATAPDIKTPEQVKEVAAYIGNILRSCKVKRGLGTIRQDVNVSIKKGNRIEIKGVQDLDLIPKIVDEEIKRQMDFVSKKKEFESEVRQVLPDQSGKTKFLRPMPGSARMYPETDLPLLKIHLNLINEAKKDLPKLRTEIKGELKKKGLSEEEVSQLFKEDRIEEFKDLLNVINNPKLVAKVMLIFTKEVATKNKLDSEKVLEVLNSEILAFVLEKFKEGKISERQIKDSLEKIASGFDLEDSVKFGSTDYNVVEEFVLKILKEKPGLNSNAYMGLVMKEFKGKVEGKEVMSIIGKHLK